MIQDEDLLLAVLNSSPVVNGARTEQLAGEPGEVLAMRYGSPGTLAELKHLRHMRETLQALIRGREEATSDLNSLLDGSALIPTASPVGLEWDLDTPEDRRLAVRVAMAWSRVEEEMPGRLRACANMQCNLFLIDRSRPGSAKWCSMAVCGNRVKTRAHASRKRKAQASE